MKSKLVAMFLFITITASIITVPVIAYEGNIFYDYEPGEMPENMFKSDEEVRAEYGDYGFLDFVHPSCPQDNNPAVSVEKTDTTYIITGEGNKGEIISGSAPSDLSSVHGIYFDGNAIKGNNADSTGTIISGDIAGGKNYVYSIQVRNKNSDIEPNVYLRLWDSDYALYPNAHYSKEYDKAGMKITGTDWIDLKGTIENPDDSQKEHNGDNADEISLGFPSTKTYAGSEVEFNFTDESEGMYRAYFAEEKPYNITNTLTTDNSALEEGGQAAFKAEVLNQVGLPGYLEQDLKWKVMNKARTSEIDGFTIKAGEDGTATVKVNGAKAGTYDVVAYSEKYKMAKGVEITVRGEEVTKINIDNTVSGKFTLDGLEVVKSEAEKILVVVASYTNTEGVKKIEDVDKAELTVIVGTAQLSDEITITVSKGNDVRVFVWNAANLAPVTLASGVVAEYKIQ